MTGSIISSPQLRLLTQRRELHQDERLREKSRSKRAEILEQISQHPNANEGLKAQARLYRERLEAGMEHPDDR